MSPVCVIPVTAVAGIAYSELQTHEHFIVLDFCEVWSVNFLKTLNYLIKVCFEVNMKQLNKVSSESDR